ncbi:MAG: pyridoxal phosphate-dependent aminotransferase [Gammaproteobacteria bacterium]|nr:pyridoxal phosphate-dependent aminotransferase [Gammaproteobacteria bacterium]
MQNSDKHSDEQSLRKRRARSRIEKAEKLLEVRYEIRGKVLQKARRLEQEGHRVLKLNIGNTAPFGFEAPESILRAVIHELPRSQGYEDAKGIFTARNAVVHESQRIGIPNVDVDDVYLGNGVSELIVMATQALLNPGDEVLVPAPDYPLWTAAVLLAGGTPVHYRCDEEADWYPDLQDIQAKTTSRTKAMVVINPNNPTGAVYERSLLSSLAEWARQHNIVVFADEIYSKVLYDDAEYIPMASIDDEVLTLTFNGLSKSYHVPGFRVGWMIVSGALVRARSFIDGLDTLASMRLCPNVPVQHAVPAALGGYQAIFDETRPSGLLYEQRNAAHESLTSIPGISCFKPKGSIFLFPRIDTKKYKIYNDEKFVYDLLMDKKILVVQGSGFNYPVPDHFRIVFLSKRAELFSASESIGAFLATYSQNQK